MRRVGACMRRRRPTDAREAGVALLDVMIALLVLFIVLLPIAGLLVGK